MVAGPRDFRQRKPLPARRNRGPDLRPGQGNNVYIFPAMGMAIFATEAKRVTEEMFIVAAKAVAEQVTEENLATGLIYPPSPKSLKLRSMWPPKSRSSSSSATLPECPTRRR